MLIHYVDDNQTDIVSLKRTLRNEKSLRIRSSERIDQITSFDNFKMTDVFVLDVVRPDAVSLEADVSTIRSYTNAPVFFLTGHDPETIRDRAMNAGAHGVMQKDNLKPNLFMQFLEQACDERLHAQLHDTCLEQPDLADLLAPSGSWPMLSPTLAASDDVLAYLEHAMSGLTTTPAATDPVQIGKTLQLLQLTRRIGSRSFSESVLSDASRIMMETFDELSTVIRASGVKVTIDLLGNAPFWSVGSRRDAETGLRALTEGLIHLCEPGDWLHVDVSCLDTMTRIDVTSPRPLISNCSQLFRAQPTTGDTPSYASGLLQCAVHLLALRPEQVTTSNDITHRISVFL